MKAFTKISLVVLSMFIFAVACEKADVPEQPVEKKGKAQKVLIETVQGEINGIPFTAELLISEFVRKGANTFEKGGKVYALATLRNISGDNLPASVNDLVGQVLQLPVGFDQNQIMSSNDVTLKSQRDCPVLFLQLGPLYLDLLGLVVELDQVTLEIRAEQGPGNLLGNLLCAVLGILDRGGPLAALVNHLNRIIDIIGVLL
jgi:hypothetical protein